MSIRRQIAHTVLGCGLLAGTLPYSPLTSASQLCALHKSRVDSSLEQEILLNQLVECAQAGNPNAQLNLGRLLVKAQSDSDTDSDGAIWYQKAASQGLAQAQFELALLYLNGKAIQENRSLAMDWLDRAARQGHQQARFIFEHLLNDDFSIGC